MKPTLILALLTATALLACHTSCPEGCDIGDTLQKLRNLYPQQ